MIADVTRLLICLIASSWREITGLETPEEIRSYKTANQSFRYPSITSKQIVGAEVSIKRVL